MVESQADNVARGPRCWAYHSTPPHGRHPRHDRTPCDARTGRRLPDSLRHSRPAPRADRGASHRAGWRRRVLRRVCRLQPVAATGSRWPGERLIGWCAGLAGFADGPAPPRRVRAHRPDARDRPVRPAGDARRHDRPGRRDRSLVGDAATRARMRSPRACETVAPGSPGNPGNPGNRENLGNPDAVGARCVRRIAAIGRGCRAGCARCIHRNLAFVAGRHPSPNTDLSRGTVS